MQTYDQKLEAFARTLEAAQIQGLIDRKCDCEVNRQNCAVTVKRGGKYARVDVGTSGKYMVDADGQIFGIKGYGKIHRGHQYGTLDTLNEWNWREYHAVRWAAERQGVA